MITKVKLGKEVLLFVLDGIGSPTVIKGTVCGCITKDLAMSKRIYQIQTANGLIYRLPSELWESVEALKNDIENFVDGSK